MNTPATVTTIPAQPGYTGLHVMTDPNDDTYIEFHRTPVIAWRIITNPQGNWKYDDSVDPICDDGTPCNYVERPDGTVYQIEVNEYANATEALNDAKKAHQQTLKHRKILENKKNQ